MAGNGLVKVRMRRHMANFVDPHDLEMDEVYEITPERAAQFFREKWAEPVDGKKAAPLEAAALAPAGRRG